MSFAHAPTVLSLARVPLGVAFVSSGRRPAVAMGLLAASGLSDVLDGFIARRYGLVSASGAVIDGLTDKWFVACVIASLVARGNLPPLGVLAMMTRELTEIPLALREFNHREHETPMANRAGKIATALQFASIAAAIVGAKKTRNVLLAATAGAGLFAGLTYWRRALSSSAHATILKP
jgi:cardiolipin synthase (CMP-forming)